MTKAEFITKSVYGRDLYYPNNWHAINLIRLTRKTTADAGDFRILRKLGFEVIVNGKPYFN